MPDFFDIAHDITDPDILRRLQQDERERENVPADYHDDRPGGWTEDDRNSGCTPSQILGR